MNHFKCTNNSERKHLRGACVVRMKVWISAASASHRKVVQDGRLSGDVTRDVRGGRGSCCSPAEVAASSGTGETGFLQVRQTFGNFWIIQHQQWVTFSSRVTEAGDVTAGLSPWRPPGRYHRWLRSDWCWRCFKVRIFLFCELSEPTHTHTHTSDYRDEKHRKQRRRERLCTVESF